MISSKTEVVVDMGKEVPRIVRKRRNAVASLNYSGTRPPPNKMGGRSFENLTKFYLMAFTKFKKNNDIRKRVLLTSHMNYIRDLIVTGN